MGGCSQKKDIDMIVIWYKASCTLVDSSLQNKACILYKNDYSGDTESDCENLKVILNATTSSHVFDDYTCDESNVSGVCVHQLRRLHFYNTHYTSSEATNECYAMGGSPQPL